MISSCLKVRSSDRPTCDKILAMPGLLNHLTGTLEEIDYQAPVNDNEDLLKTIKMPRRMGQITERLPAPQYDNDQMRIKRTNSLPAQSKGLLNDGKKPANLGRDSPAGDNSSVNQGSPNDKDMPKRGL